MQCEAHAERSANATCSVCNKPRCDACMTYEVDGRAACRDCGAVEEERSLALGAAVFAFVGCGYLATLAIGFLVFRARPFIGGLAAVAALGLGRVLQGFVRLPQVSRRVG